VGDIENKMYSIKFKCIPKNQVFWKEKSVEKTVTLEGLPFDSSMISSHIQKGCSKTRYIHCKTMFTC
jgi:hypothetical protein